MTRYVALYCRLSPRPDGSYEGVDDQEKWGREYAASKWPDLPVQVFSDKGISAANGDDRPRYEALRATIRAGEIVHLWVVEQSRLERREVEWFTLAAELDVAGITEVHTNRDGVVRVRDEVAGIKAVLNASEVRKLKRRVNDRLDAIAAQGRPAGSVVFGYRHGVDDQGGKTLHVIPEQADAIRWAADQVLAGWSLSNVAVELRNRGLRGAHGGALTARSVRSMLTSPTIAGQRVHRGQVVGPGVWEPILDEQTWQAVKVKLTGARIVRRSDGGTYPISSRHIGNPAGRKYVLTGGLAVCGVCGAPLVGSVKQLKNGKRKPYLLCHPRTGGRACVGIMLPETEAYVVDQLFTELDKPEFLDAITADDHASRRDEITAALTDLDRQREELAALWATPGQLTTTEWQAARNGLAEYEQKLRNDLAAVPPPLVSVDISTARESWPLMTLDEQREFIRLFVSRVTINRATPGTQGFDSKRVSLFWRVM